MKTLSEHPCCSSLSRYYNYVYNNMWHCNSKVIELVDCISSDEWSSLDIIHYQGLTWFDKPGMSINIQKYMYERYQKHNHICPFFRRGVTQHYISTSGHSCYQSHPFHFRIESANSHSLSWWHTAYTKTQHGLLLSLIVVLDHTYYNRLVKVVTTTSYNV